MTIPPKAKPPAPRLPDRLTEFITTQSEEMPERDSDPMQRIIEQVLNAESADAVLTPVDVKQASEIVGIPFVLFEFDLNESEYDAGSPFFASMVCGLPPDGEPTVINCGHKKVIAQLVKLRQFDALPAQVKFITRGKSKQGTPMLELTKWSEDDGPPPF